MNLKRKQSRPKDEGKQGDPHALELSELLRGIEAEADATIAKVEAGAEEYAAKKIKEAQNKANALISESMDIGKTKADAIIAVSKAKIAREQGKITLEEEEQYIRRALEAVALYGTKAHLVPNYQDRVFAWVCEAAIGLSVEEAKIDAAETERVIMSSDFLQRAETAIAKLSGTITRLKLSDSKPIADHGVILSTPDGRIRYDNRIATRYGRSDSALREAIRSYLEEHSDPDTIAEEKLASSEES